MRHQLITLCAVTALTMGSSAQLPDEMQGFGIENKEPHGQRQCFVDCEVRDLGGGLGLQLQIHGGLYRGGRLELEVGQHVTSDGWLILSTSPARSELGDAGALLADPLDVMRLQLEADGWATVLLPDRTALQFVPGQKLYAQLLMGDTTSNTLELTACESTLMTREEAMLMVERQIIAAHPAADTMAGYSFPEALGPGQVVASSDPASPSARLVVEDCSWMFYLDANPAQSFPRESIYVLVSGTASDPSVRSVRDGWYPTIDTIAVYEWPDENQVSNDWFYGELSRSAHEDDEAAVAIAPPPMGGGKMYSLGFVGPGKYNNDYTKFMKPAAMAAGGVMAGDSHFGVLTEAQIKVAVKEANEACASCVFVTISAHGRANGDLDGLGTGPGSDITPAELAGALAGLKACSVYVMISSCSAGHHIQPIMDALKGRDGPQFAHSPATCAVMTSSSKTGCSLTDPNGPCAGSEWLKAFGKCWQEADADGNGDGTVDPLEASTWVEDKGGDDANAGDPQWGGQSLAECGTPKEHDEVPVDVSEGDTNKGKL